MIHGCTQSVFTFRKTSTATLDLLECSHKNLPFAHTCCALRARLQWHVRSPSYIIPEMFLRGSSFMRLVATALPLCLMWTFVACLALCSDHSKDENGHYAQMNAQSVTESTHCGDCPIPVSSFVLPDRQSHTTPDVSVTNHLTFAASTLLVSTIPQRVNCRPDLHSSSDPPLERLNTLRI